MQVSGIGGGARLRAAGIPVVHDLPAVGENLQDHLQLRLIFKVSNVRTLNEWSGRLSARIGMGLQYLLFRRGPLTMAPSQLGLFARSDLSRETANLQYHVQPLSLDRFGEPLHPFPAFTASVCNVRPESRGTVLATSPDPFASPAIRPNYLATPGDRRVAVEAIRLTRRICAARALAPYAPREHLPGAELESEEELARAAGDIGTTIFHPVGDGPNGTGRRGRRAPPGARRGRAAGGGRLHHADHHLRQHQLANDHDRGEGGGLHPRRGLNRRMRPRGARSPHACIARDSRRVAPGSEMPERSGARGNWREETMSLSILSVISLPEAVQEEVHGVDPSIELTMAPGWFDGEIRETWPAFTSDRYLRADSTGRGTREERDALLAEAEIVVLGFPFPLDVRARAPNLRWVHQRPAGASNMLRGDLWDAGVVVTSSRGHAHNLPIAEYVLAGILHFAKGLHVAETERAGRRFRAAAYAPVQLAGKTVCVVGAGGIGREVGRLCAAAGMRVVGTRREPAPPSHGFSEIRGAGGLLDLLAESDFVAVCCQWTPETEKLIGREAFAAMKEGAVLVNIARGEIVDEEALAGALASGKLRGAALDVYVGEFDHAPDARLWNDPRVLLTPHVSAASDVTSHRGAELFVENLRRFVAGEPLANVIDWVRGY